MWCVADNDNYIKDSGYNNILQDKTLFCAFETCDIVGWLVNPPIAKWDLFKSADCRWSCKTYAEYCYRNSAKVCRLVLCNRQFFVGVPAIYVVKVYECHPLDYMCYICAKDFQIWTLIKQLLTKYNFFTKLPQISHINKNVFFFFLSLFFKYNWKEID